MKSFRNRVSSAVRRDSKDSSGSKSSGSRPSSPLAKGSATRPLSRVGPSSSTVSTHTPTPLNTPDVRDDPFADPGPVPAAKVQRNVSFAEPAIAAVEPAEAPARPLDEHTPLPVPTPIPSLDLPPSQSTLEFPPSPVEPKLPERFMATDSEPSLLETPAPHESAFAPSPVDVPPPPKHEDEKHLGRYPTTSTDSGIVIPPPVEEPDAASETEPAPALFLAPQPVLIPSAPLTEEPAAVEILSPLDLSAEPEPEPAPAAVAEPVVLEESFEEVVSFPEPEPAPVPAPEEMPIPASLPAPLISHPLSDVPPPTSPFDTPPWVSMPLPHAAPPKKPSNGSLTPEFPLVEVDMTSMAPPRPSLADIMRNSSSKSVTFASSVQEIPDTSIVRRTDSFSSGQSRDKPKLSDWTEHILPDTSYYYSLAPHISPTRTAVVTDIDLRMPRALYTVWTYIRSLPLLEHPGADVELYLRNVASVPRAEFVPMTTWISHAARTAGIDPPGKDEATTDEQRLEREAQYWMFMDAHPAHVNLPEGAHEEAVEAITWSYTDRLLQSSYPRGATSPFTHSECHELLELLRGMSMVGKTRYPIHTRIVSKIHLRMAQWRQQFVIQDSFPPKQLTRPRGNDEAVHARPTHRLPFQGVFVTLFKTIVCLGIPYLFERDSENRYAEDMGVNRRVASGLVYGAGVSLVGAFTLSASVTLLGLQNLDELARTLALTSTLCSVASLAASLLVMYRRRKPRRPSTDGGILAAPSPTAIASPSSVAAVPAVLLTYALATFVAAVVVYAVRAGDPRRVVSGSASVKWLIGAETAVLCGVLLVTVFCLRSRSS